MPDVGRAFSRASKGRLTRRDIGRFSGGGLFDRIGRAACDAGCLPRKELYEAWEVARRTRRLFRGGRVVDLAAGDLGDNLGAAGDVRAACVRRPARSVCRRASSLR